MAISYSESWSQQLSPYMTPQSFNYNNTFQSASDVQAVSIRLQFFMELLRSHDNLEGEAGPSTYQMHSDAIPRSGSSEPGMVNGYYPSNYDYDPNNFQF